MADRLSIYKGALRLLGPHELSALTDDRPERYQLDDAWTDAVNHMLHEGFWNFAIRTVELSNDEDVAPRLGYDYAFSKPTDWVRTLGISNEATFRPGFEQYEDEAGYWFADVSTLYLRYVSDDDEYGWNIGAWPLPFAKALEAYLAYEVAMAIPGDRGNRNDIFVIYQKRLRDAKIKDAVDEPVDTKPAGRLVRARFSRLSGKDG